MKRIIVNKINSPIRSKKKTPNNFTDNNVLPNVETISKDVTLENNNNDNNIMEDNFQIIHS